MAVEIGNWNSSGAPPGLTLVFPRQAGGGEASLPSGAEKSGGMDHSAGRNHMGHGSSVY